jgi:SulP family sulfate permease
MSQQKPITQRLFPFLLWWPLVNRDSLWSDLVAGLTGAVIVLPQGVAFALIAGLPPEYGLYTAMITPIVAALFGSSLHLISGPTTAISIVVFSALSNYADPGTSEFIQLAFVLAFMAGLMQFALGLARMGTLVNFVSHTVVIGFTAGAAVLIVTSQLKHVLGIEIPRGESFLHTWGDILRQLDEVNFYVLAVGLGTLFIALLFRKLLPKWPYMLFAMVLGSLLSLVLKGTEHGVALVGEIPGALPPFSMPQLTASNIRQLAPDAFAIALLGLIEAVSIAKSIASHTKQRIDGNQEFIGQGLSNLIGSFFSCYPGSGSFTRSGVNHQAGAKTPLAAIFAAVILALILLLIAPYTAYLPIPAMGGIILLVGYNLIDFHHIKTVFKTSKREAAILLVTFGATLFLELEFAIYLGVLLSLVFYLQRTSKPRIVRMAPDPAKPKRQFTNIDRVVLPECPQMLMVRIDGSLFFGAVDTVAAYLNELTEKYPEQKNLLIVANGINFIDLTGAELLMQEVSRWRSLGGDVYISGLKRPGRKLLKKMGLWEQIGEDHFFWSKNEALAAIYPQLNRSICDQCEKRIFLECGPKPDLNSSAEPQEQTAP